MDFASVFLNIKKCNVYQVSFSMRKMGCLAGVFWRAKSLTVTVPPFLSAQTHLTAKCGIFRNHYQYQALPLRNRSGGPGSFPALCRPWPGGQQQVVGLESGQGSKGQQQVGRSLREVARQNMSKATDMTPPTPGS